MGDRVMDAARQPLPVVLYCSLCPIHDGVFGRYY